MVATPNDYVEFLKEEYPDIDESVLKEILKIGIGNLQSLIQKDHDVTFGNYHPDRLYKLTFVRSTNGQKKRNTRAKYNKSRLDTLRKERKNVKKSGS
jgi:hypothetical protein